MTGQYRLNSIVQLHDEVKPTFMLIKYISEYGEVSLKGICNKYEFAYQEWSFLQELVKGRISIASY